jgi:hypothetical protein
MLERTPEKEKIVINEASAVDLVAPCRTEGEAITQDEETREGCCNCPTHHCLIDSRNRVIQQTPRSELQV